jgi:predicted ATPase
MNALRLSSYKESVNYLIRGLELLATLPDTPERTQQEFDLQMALGLALMATEGHTSTNVEQVYSRAWILCQHMDESPELFSVLWGLWQYYCSRATLQSAWEIGNQLLTLAQRTNNPAHLLAAHASLGCTLWYRGEFAAARPYLQPGITLSDSEEQRDHAFRYGISPEVRCLSYGAANLWLLGYPEQGLQMSCAALELAQELTHSPSLVFALYWVACLYQFRREVYTTQEMLKASLILATEEGLTLWVANGACLKGWVLAMLGQEEEGIAQMRQGLTDISTKGLVGAQPGYLSLLAEVNGRIGKVDEGLCILAEALSLVNENGQRHMEAELYRLKGELILAQSLDNIEETETCFQQALEVARSQQAKSWELRAATSLARLWQSQGKRAEARELLEPVYSWFTEGFDTADLLDAKKLLDELA